MEIAYIYKCYTSMCLLALVFVETGQKGGGDAEKSVML